MAKRETIHWLQAPNGIKTELKPNKFLSLKIPLPLLIEQMKIVEKIKKIEYRITEIKTKNIFSMKLAKNVLSSESTKIYDELAQNGVVKLKNICRTITDGTHITPTYIFSGVPFISVKDISTGVINFSDTKFISKQEHNELTKRCKPEREDILLTKVGTIGYAKMIDVDNEFSIFVSLALLKVNKEKILPKFLEYILNSTRIREIALRKTRGVGNKNLVLKFIKDFPIPNISIDKQKQIISKLDKIKIKTDTLLSEYIVIRKEINALMPSVFAQAFNGEL